MNKCTFKFFFGGFMKYFSIFLILFLASMTLSYSKVWTVSNDSTNFPAQYYNLQTVIDSVASDGDTLMVCGTSNSTVKSYGNIYLRKPLTIIGAGSVLNSKIRNNTIFDIVYIDTSHINIIASNINTINSTKTNGANNLLLSRNRILNVIIKGDSVKIFNNYIGSININYHANILISNNIIYNYSAEWWDSLYMIFYSNKNTVSINNNIISYNLRISYPNVNVYSFFAISNAILSNNIIFMGNMRNPNNAPTFCSFNNNLTYKMDNDTIPFGNNYGDDNIFGNDPKFNGWDANTGLADINVWEKDFHLKSDSPGKNAGTDGTDIGIFGGAYPWPQYLDGTDNKGQAHLPTVNYLNILNTVVGKNGKIKFKVKGEAVK
jgi:hypothetical protein